MRVKISILDIHDCSCNEGCLVDARPGIGCHASIATLR